MRNASPTLPASRPARQHEGHAEIEIFEQPPVERLAEAARPRRLARRARIEQQPVGDLGVEPDGDEIGAFAAIGDRLHHRQAEALLERATRAGVSLP